MQRKLFPDVIGSKELVKIRDINSVRDAAVMMSARNIGAVLVCEGDKLLGILTERDLMRKVVAAKLDPDKVTVGEVMTKSPETLAPTATAMEALGVMNERGFRHLPVVDEQGRVIGMVSIRDLYSAVQASTEEELRQCEAFVFTDGYGTGA